MRENCQVRDITIGPERPLVVIAGPCVLEDASTNELIGMTVRGICRELGLPFIFKASFDKANRSSVHSPRGPGLDDGLSEFARLRNLLGVPVLTDVHEPAQAAPVASAVDMLQVPAFLCRQTDLLTACARTGKPVAVKKGQFLAPTEMRHVVAKLREAGAHDVLLTERGTFFGYGRLVNDFIGVAEMAEIGPPVCFDVTHSTQLPGTGAERTGGCPERADVLTRAAVAAGVDCVFIECHPDPPNAQSDAATVQPLERMPELLGQAAAVAAAVGRTPAMA